MKLIPMEYEIQFGIVNMEMIDQNQLIFLQIQKTGFQDQCSKMEYKLSSRTCAKRK